METYESPIQTLYCDQSSAYTLLSDLRNLESVKDKLPQTKLKDMVCDQDSCTVTVDPIGPLTLRIVERTPENTIKFGADNAPIAFHLWIQLKSVSDVESRMKITVKADIPFMIKPMIGNKVEGFVTQLAEMIATLINSK